MRIVITTGIRSRRIAGILGSVVVASALASGVAAAADSSPAPIADTPPPAGGTIVVSGGSLEAGPQLRVGRPAGCATIRVVTVGPDGTQTVEDGPTDLACESGTVAFGEGMMGGPGGPMMIGEPFGPPMRTGPGMGGGSGLPGVVTIAAEPSATVEVTAVDGSTVSLRTDDGWTRDVDTSTVAVTLDSETLTAADLSVGDRVQVYQVRNADDTYTVTGLALVLPEVTGTVSAIGDAGFSVTEPDGTTTVVAVTDETRWPLSLPGATGSGLDGLTDGSLVHVRGTLGDDGTLTATEVLAIGATFTVGGPGMPVPGGPAPMPAPVEPAPEASAAP